MDDLLTQEEWEIATHQIDMTGGEVYGDDLESLKAQSAKTRAALVAERWKSPEVWEQIRDAAVFLARADERKAIGKWIEHTYPTYGPDYLVPIKDVDALLKGERP
jgi:hypothetical protein